eukprot:SAG31_NODE_2381_length_5829_cov_4.002967_3_plen_945_part_00
MIISVRSSLYVQAAGARCTAVEFGVAIQSPLSEIDSAGHAWWKLRLPQRFQPAVMGVALCRLRRWHRADELPLFVAIRAGSEADVNRLLSEAAVGCRTEHTGQQNSSDATATASDCCRAVDLRDFRGFTAVLLAAKQGNVEIFSTVLRASANPTLAKVTGVEDCSMLDHTVTNVGSRDGAVVPAITKAHISVAGESALLVAAACGHVKLVEWLLADNGGRGSAAHMLELAAFAEVPEVSVAASEAALDRKDGNETDDAFRRNWRQRWGWISTFSGGSNCYDLGKNNHINEPSPLAWQRRGGQMPVHRAAACGHCAVVKVLIQAGADPTTRDAGGFTALHCAVAAATVAMESGDTETVEATARIVKVLLEGSNDRKEQLLTATLPDGRTTAQLLPRNVNQEGPVLELCKLLKANAAVQTPTVTAEAELQQDSSHKEQYLGTKVPHDLRAIPDRPPLHRMRWPENQDRVDSSMPLSFSAQHPRSRGKVHAPVAELHENAKASVAVRGVRRGKHQGACTKDCLHVAAITKLLNGANYADEMDAVRHKLDEMEISSMPIAEDSTVPAISEAAAMNARRRIEEDRYKNASDELFHAPSPEELTRLSMEARGDGALGQVASFGFLGGGKVSNKLINEAATNQLIATGKLKHNNTTAATEVGTLSGPIGKQTLTFRNVQPKTFDGRGFHTTQGVAVLEICECENLRELPGVIALMPDLRGLDVQKNKLENLPAGVGKLNKLDFLDCSHNALSELPTALGNLLEMQTLRAAGNKLTSLPATLEACQWLTELDLTANLLVELPSVVADLGGLRVLKVAGNLLKELPQNLGQQYLDTDADGLDILDISRNRFRQLPKTLLARGLPRDELSATDNHIDALCEEFFCLKTLRTLRLSRNQLTTGLGLSNLDDDFSIQIRLPQLQRVALSGNMIGPDDVVVDVFRRLCEKNGGFLRL